MARVAVIILNWNGEKLLREFLPSVVKYTDPGLGRIVVADNASEDDSVRILEQEFPEVELIRFSQNHGFAGGYNRAVGLVPEEIVVLLNSDVEVAPGWLEPLVALLDEEPGIAAVQPKILAYTNRNHFEYAGACGANMMRCAKCSGVVELPCVSAGKAICRPEVWMSVFSLTWKKSICAGGYGIAVMH